MDKKKKDSIKKLLMTEEENRIKIEDENRQLKSQLKSVQRESTLFKSLSRIIKEKSPLSSFKLLKAKNKTKHLIQESAVLMLSDSHADQEILGKRVQGLEEFNFDVACRRAENIVDSTIDHLTKNLQGYQFKKLYILGLGDYIAGEIHNMKEHTKWKNGIKNAMAMGELIALMISDLSRYFPEIIFCSVSGNHGRRSLKKDYHGAHNNWDYLVAMYATTRLQNLIDEKRLKINIPDSWSMGIAIEGWNFIINHGDDIRSWNSVPWYGIERKTRRLNALGSITNKVPNYFLYGHFHTTATQQHTTGETFINGSWPATDEYALEALGAFSEPFQWLFGVHPKHGASWRLPIKLRKNNWKTDERETGRYRVTIFEDTEVL